MAKKIHQFTDIEANKNILEDYLGVTKLGIQGVPGIEFKLNESPFSITIGNSGIYELDLTGLGGMITSLIFNNISDNIIVDIIYEGGNS